MYIDDIEGVRSKRLFRGINTNRNKPNITPIMKHSQTTKNIKANNNNHEYYAQPVYPPPKETVPTSRYQKLTR